MDQLLQTYSGSQYLLLVGCFVLSLVIAYKDVDSFFKSKRIGLAPVFKHRPTLLFLLGNSALAVVLLGWSYSSPNAAINSVIPDPLSSDFSKALFIGLGLPMLLRSRISGDPEQNDLLIGLEGLYKWVKDKVLIDLNRYSGHEKRKQARQLSQQHHNANSVADLIEDLRKFVRDDVGFSQDQKRVSQFSKQFDDLITSRTGGDSANASVSDLEKVIRLVLDTIGVKPTVQYFRSLEDD